MPTREINYIIGRGSIGSLVAAVLQQAALDFCFVDTRDAATSGELQINYQYQQSDLSLTSKVITLAEAKLATANIFICVKSFQLEPLLQSLAKQIKPATRLYLLQNGMGHAEVAAEICPQAQLRIISLTSAANCQDNRVNIVNWGRWYIGSINQAAADNHDQQFIQALAVSQVDVSWSNTITDKLLDKLLINACIYPVTALYGIKNGDIGSRRFALLLRQLANELAQFTHSQQQPRSAQQIIESALAVAEKTSDNRSSMLQDVSAKRATEIDAILGYILNQQNAADLPLLRWLYTKIKANS